MYSEQRKHNKYMHYYQSSDTVFGAVALHKAHRGCLHQMAERSTKALHASLPAQDVMPT